MIFNNPQKNTIYNNLNVLCYYLSVPFKQHLWQLNGYLVNIWFKIENHNLSVLV